MNVPRIFRRLFRLPYDGLRHFGVVTDGILYRCGQQEPAQLAEHIDKHGLKTVVSLRGSRDAGDPDAWEAQERAVCDAKGVAFVTIPCNHKNPPTRAQIQQFLEITRDPGRRPALVHCRLGQQRTLLFCALYRVNVEGMNTAAAEREMDELGFNVRHYRHQRLLKSFREFAAPAAEPATSTR